MIEERLFALQDKEYRCFQAKLIPEIPEESVIGVRVPVLRKLAKQLLKEEPTAVAEFLQELPHRYYDENLLHGYLLSAGKDYRECIQALDIFLPYVDNWAVCDTMSPVIFKKYPEELLTEIIRWSKSNHLYTRRFAVGMLMRYFLDEHFQREYLEIPVEAQMDGYYMQMMVAWFFATALAKQWDATFPYITEKRLERWTHNKTIQKARESFRITPEQKQVLQEWKI